MATAVAAVVFVFLLTFTSAHLPSDQPQNDFLSTDHSSVSNPKILLPSESGPAAVVETKPEETQLIDSESHDNNEVKPAHASDPQTESVPLTTVFTLRPVNHRFSRVPFFPIRRGYKCHGRHRHHRGFAGQGQISFGNDMIVAKDQDRDSDPAHTGGQRPERWEKFNHGGKRFSLTNDETGKQEMYKMFHGRPHFHHHRHNHRHHHGGEEHGIIYSIRKFLNF